MSLIGRKAVVVIVGTLVSLASQAIYAQCSRGGGSGRSGLNMPTSTNGMMYTNSNYNNQPYNPGVSSNNAAFQVALQSQRQQMEFMYQQMMLQQQQLAALQQEVAAKKAQEKKEKEQQLVAERQEKAKEKKEQKAAKLAATRAKLASNR